MENDDRSAGHTPSDTSNLTEDNTALQPMPIGVAKTRHPKKVIILALFVVLVAAGLAGLWIWSKTSHKDVPAATAKLNTSSGSNLSFSPNFSSVNGYASYKGAEWYSVTGGVIKVPAQGTASYFTEREGIPYGPPTGLTVHNDKLWVSTQNGVAVLKDDGSGFSEVPVIDKTSHSDQMVLNGKIYNDSSSNKMYLNDFKNFYDYNDSSNKWEAVAGNGSDAPTDISSFAANNDFVVATAHANSNGTPVWMFDKKASKWKVNQPASLESVYSTSTFSLDGQIFVMGRTKGYEGCGSTQSKLAGTTVYRLGSNGAWQPLTDFNKDAKRPELVLVHHVKDPAINVYTRSCDGGNSTEYTVQFANNTLVLGNPQTLASEATVFEGSDNEQQVLVDELIKATGQYPSMRVLAVDQMGNVIYSYSTRASSFSRVNEEELAIAKGTDIHSSTKLNIANRKDYDTLRPIMCGGSFNYLFVGTQEGSEGGPTGNWATAKILKLDGASSSELASFTDAADPHFACSGSKITWLGKQSVQQLDLATKQIKAVGPKLGTDLDPYSSSFYPLNNGDGWALVRAVDNKENSTWILYYVDSTKGTVEKLTSTIIGSQVSLNEGTGTSASVVMNGTDADHQKLAIYNRKGSVIFTKEYLSPVVSIATGDDNSVILLTGVDAHQTVFKNFTANKLTFDGKQTPISSDKIATYSLYDYNDHNLVSDPVHKQIWISDSQFGLFTIPLP